MTVIIIVAVLLGAGVVFLLRSPPPAPPKPAEEMTDADARALRKAVLERLQERLVGWSYEVPEDKPFDLIATESATERHVQMNLKQLGAAWHPLFSQRKVAEADDLVEAFVEGVTGQGEGDDSEADNSGLIDMLSLRLARREVVPEGALSRPAGPVVAVLIVRNAQELPVVTTDQLEELGLTEGQAFQTAFDNLKRDVDEGFEILPLGDSDPPDAIAIAPHDNLATSYVLVPGLAQKIRKSLGNRDGRFYLDADSLVAAVEGAEVERDKPILEQPIKLDELAWSGVPA